jgi:hypothetical protein
MSSFFFSISYSTKSFFYHKLFASCFSKIYEKIVLVFIKRVDYPIFSTKYKGIHWFPLQLARFPTGERWGQQDVGHGIVATGRGVLRFRSFNRFAVGSQLFAFPVGH